MYVQKIQLSNSVNGRNIKITATSSPGTLLHTAVSGSDDLDEPFIYAVNTSAAAVTLTIEYGGVVDPDDHIPIRLEPDKGDYLIIAGSRPVNNGVEIRAFASVANVINVGGYANRMHEV